LSRGFADNREKKSDLQQIVQLVGKNMLDNPAKYDVKCYKNGGGVKT
jgi:hypothetical protein